MMKNISNEFQAAKIISLSFLGTILVGTLLLQLPVSTHAGRLNGVDALFMATSAVCVTGLSVIDIGTQFTRFGQIVMLCLIQIGGLGIMTFSLLFSLFLGLRTTLASRLSVATLSRKLDATGLLRTLALIFLMTVFLEGIGAALLFWRLKEMHTFQFALFSSVFHAVSAFCNAGFSLYRDSLTGFQKEFWLPAVMMLLIILGGLGFVVMDELYLWGKSFFQKRKFSFSLHTRIALVGSFVLLLAGALFFFFLERHNQFNHLSLPGQWFNSLFLSVTARTAGFNTVDTPALSNATLFFLILLMFVGGCPGSAAGGIKVNTFAVLIALIKGQVKGQGMTSIFKRKIPASVIGKSLAIFTAAFIIINLTTLLLQITEGIGISHVISQSSFLELFFEATSAFGTVGLSTGVTPHLTAGGKLLTTFLMFAGRVGPLTLGIVILSRRKQQGRFEYAEEEIIVG